MQRDKFKNPMEIILISIVDSMKLMFVHLTIWDINSS